jgi:23S rRNA (cytidine1920-2'-O)/16S rRNA (cytidine1409-2'-O)-methyltransferase
MSVRPRFRNVVCHVQATRPDITDPEAAIAARRLIVDGVIVTNANAQVRTDAPVILRRPDRLRGEAKLEAALRGFGVTCTSAVCLDVGAAAGGFTRVLVRHGAALVYALDAGVGQLRGDLRADPRVVNLERVNVADAAQVIPAYPPIQLMTADLSYISLADALPQLTGVPFAARADLIALVKPMFELGRSRPPTEDADLDEALNAATYGAARAGWKILSVTESPVSGSRGAREALLHARRMKAVEVQRSFPTINRLRLPSRSG